MYRAQEMKSLFWLQLSEAAGSYLLQSSLVKQALQEACVLWKKKTMPQVVVLQAGFVARTSFPSLKLFPIQMAHI